MKIEKHVEFAKQMCQLGRHIWSVPRLCELSRNFKVMDVPLDHLNVANYYEKLNLRGMVLHMRATINADMSKPIILDEDNEIMDGRHRIMNALLHGKKTIKAVRFETNPLPCSEKD